MVFYHCLFINFDLFSKAKWTFLVYMEDDNNLSPFAKYNLSDMLKANSSENLNVLIQCNQVQSKDINNVKKPQNRSLYRYRVAKNVLELESSFPMAPNHSCVKELVDFFKWGSSKYPAERYALVLWNHGVGIVDPVWGIMNPWLAKNQDLILSNPRAYISEVVAKQENQDNSLEDSIHRGILFNETSKTYMSNQQLSDSLRQITALINKKIDVVGMDACLMAMLEVGYQIKNYADVLVASQDVERAEGWYYSAFLSPLASGTMNNFDLAQSIVLSYELYYKQRAQIYTQSAINLSNIDLLKNNVDQVVSLLQRCQNQFGSTIKQMVTNARTSCLQFNTPSYIDLHSFYFELHKQLNNPNVIRECIHHTSQQDAACSLGGIEPSYTVLPDNYYEDNVIRSEHIDNEDKDGFSDDYSRHLKPNLAGFSMMHHNKTGSKDLDALKNTLQAGMRLIESSVIANSCGKALERARGVSIYYPNKYGRIDISYLHTDFARDSLWIEFLKNYI